MTLRPRDPLWLAWKNMRFRCANLNHKDYHRYGGRGITVCAKWQDFAAFAADIGPHPGKGWTLDRIDNNDGYRPGNCRWATRQDQVRNSSLCKLAAADATEIRRQHKDGTSQRALAKSFGVSAALICCIVSGRVWA